jgi:hypothetical protein
VDRDEVSPSKQQKQRVDGRPSPTMTKSESEIKLDGSDRSLPSGPAMTGSVNAIKLDKPMSHQRTLTENPANHYDLG